MNVYRSFKPHLALEETPPFNELILSWNGVRPHEEWLFWIEAGSKKHKYASWSKTSQCTFSSDVLEFESPVKGFKVWVEGSDLSTLHSLTVFISIKESYQVSVPPPLDAVHLSHFPLRSQQRLNHPRASSLCSPTSLSLALSYLSKTNICPLSVASAVYDEKLDIYGNWVLNTAESYHRLQIPCHVERLENFEKLHAKLKQGLPVVVSVQGAIEGAAKDYPSGHLLCVTGYETGYVYCVDPAFADDAKTKIRYPITSFLAAWGRRRGLSYVFNMPVNEQS